MTQEEIHSQIQAQQRWRVRLAWASLAFGGITSVIGLLLAYA